MRKAVILEHGGGELANQLWNYASIYAFALERGITLRNPSFFEYHSCFTMLLRESMATQMRSLWFQTPRRRDHIINRMGRARYALTSKAVAYMKASCIVSSKNTENKVTYLPPSGELPLGLEACETLYFTGWLFRNPEGLKKYRKEIIEYFQPVPRIVDTVEAYMVEMRRKYEHVVGLHIRQGDYQIFKDGKYWVEQKRVREIADEYLRFSGKDPKAVCFAIASDGPVDISQFGGLNIVVSDMRAVEDLFMLSKTDIILGSDSSFGDFAAWYGNIPHVIFKNEPVDWEYYRDKKSFFENKYCALVQY
jgi:hypothetical protein